MSKTLYAGNLSYKLSEEELREVFEAYGEIRSVKIIIDRETGRSRGFGFVEMAEAQAADEAMRALSGTDVAGRPLRVSEAVRNNARRRPRGADSPRAPRGY